MNLRRLAPALALSALIPLMTACGSDTSTPELTPAQQSKAFTEKLIPKVVAAGEQAGDGTIAPALSKALGTDFKVTETKDVLKVKQKTGDKCELVLDGEKAQTACAGETFDVMDELMAGFDTQEGADGLEKAASQAAKTVQAESAVNMAEYDTLDWAKIAKQVTRDAGELATFKPKGVGLVASDGTCTVEISFASKDIGERVDIGSAVCE